jgi:hypothetical protein
MPAPVKDQFLSQCRSNHLHHQLALPLGDAYAALGETGGNRLAREIRALLTLFGLQDQEVP